MNIIVSIKRNRFPIVFAVSFLLTILFTLNLINSKTENMYMDGLFNWIFNSMILLVPLSYTIISLSEYIKTKFDKKASLIIADNGINDNLSIFSCGNISWTEISDVKTATVLKTNFLVVLLTNPVSFIEKQNIFKRKILKSYFKKFGSPIVVSQKRINYDVNDLKAVLLEAKRKKASE